MENKTLPLKEMSIAEIYNGEKSTYEVPIYQRNYAWGKDEISVLIQDVYDAGNPYNENKPVHEKKTYFIGTLVSFHKGDQVYEVIDGQQRLTTINLVLAALKVIPIQNKLTYRARKKSDDTINSIPDFKIDEKDYGIINGFKYAKDAIDEIVPEEHLEEFKTYFQENVHLIHYQVPKDIDLNHYFEIMNSRGEQLEKHEIIKARLLEKLSDVDKAKLNRLWEYCSEMNVYIQQKYNSDQKTAKQIFGESLGDFSIKDFNGLPAVEDNTNMLKIKDLVNYKGTDIRMDEDNKIDTFQPIMDFSNFLLIVLKLTRMDEIGFEPKNFNLDDKELINEFDKVQLNEEFVKKYGFNLLKAKYFLDNYIVHHSNEDDTIENNPWKLQKWQKRESDNRYYPINLVDDESNTQNKLVQLLSMFEVSFTPRQRKNYLFYCLLYLFRSKDLNTNNYYEFLSVLADKYFKDIYLVRDNLNNINTPNPGSFDSEILRDNELDIKLNRDSYDFVAIYGDGNEKSKGIPLFVFNYLDYKLWKKYANELCGGKIKEGDIKRKNFFVALGCSDFGLKFFEQFYFSRTRRSLEHYYPRANANGENGTLNEDQINCFGNYAMIGSEVNSSGSNWSPKTKLDHYLDASGKIKQVSVASIKFMIMMQICKDNNGTRIPGLEWNFDDIKTHQEKMLKILLGD